MKEVTIDQAMENITNEVKKVKKLAQSGLWEAGLAIMDASKRRLTSLIYALGPLSDRYKLTGNLRASGYVRAESGVDRGDQGGLIPSENQAVPSETLPEIGVELGYTANYGLYVHENMEGRGAKFLENVIIDNADKIVEIVKRRSGEQ